MSTNIRVFEVEFRGAGGKRESVEVALCSTYTGWALVLPKPASIALGSPALERSPLAARLSNISPDEPFPKPNAATGRPRFCVKTYSENAGLLPQLVDADVLHPSGRPELRCGPLVEVALGDLEISHTCLKCARGGMLEAVETREMPGRPRLPACSGCKVARYCDAQCQKFDWSTHKKECLLWRSNPSEAARLMENTHKADLSSFLAGKNFEHISFG